MPKTYVKGADYKLYLNTNTYASPTWAEIKAVGDISIAPNPDDVEVPERGIATGHLHGEMNPEISFTLMEDTGDSNIETIIAACFSGAVKEIAVSRGAIATTGNKFFRLEAAFFTTNNANRADVGMHDIVARRHANSDYGLSRNTA